METVVAPRARLAATSIWVATLVVAAAGLVLGLVRGAAPDDLNVTPKGVVVLFTACVATYSTLGLLMVRRVDGHPIGWLFVASGGLFAVGMAANNTAKLLVLERGVGDATGVLSWIYDWSWREAIVVIVIALTLFPHRTPANALSRWLVRLMVVDGIVIALALMFRAGDLVGGSHQPNPLGVETIDGALEAALSVAEAASWVLTLAAFMALLVQYRRSTAGVRHQIRWVAAAIALFLLAAVVAGIGAAAGASLTVIPFLTAVVGIPLSMAIAVLHDRLYDIELVVNRVVVYGLLLTIVSAIYVGVLLLARAVLLGDEPPASATTVVALAIVSVVIVPLRDRLQRLADRLVFGQRSTPYHALASFAEVSLLAGRIHDTAPRLAVLLADATGASAAVVYVRVDDELLPVAREAQQPLELAPVTVDELDTALSAFDVAHRVERQGELLGAIAVTMPSGRPVRPAERRLMGQLAAQAALTFQTLRLTSEISRHAAALEAKADELQQSRRRLVSAQDGERNRIGRDLHDGAQQHLVAIIAKAGLARSQLNRDPELAGATLVELQRDTKTALAEIREFVHGVSPQILADRGLVVAVEQRAARLPIVVDVEATAGDHGRRFEASIESAAWFVISEALTNVIKHAAAQRAVVRIEAIDQLLIEVLDDGIGYSGARGSGVIGMSDRVAAVDGTLSVAQRAGGGTVVRCSLPIAERVGA